MVTGRWEQKPWLEHVDDKDHKVTRAGVYRSAAGVCYVIPVDFVTDGGSVPRLLWFWMPPFGDDAECAYVLHDFLYRHAEMFLGDDAGHISRGDVDDLMREAQIAAGQPSRRARACWLGVRSGGWRPWGKYRKAAARTATNI